MEEAQFDTNLSSLPGAVKFIKNKNMVKKMCENPLLIKSEVGVAKPTVYSLPAEPNFTYGKKNNWDKESAGDVVLHWSNWIPNPNSIPDRDYVKLNKMSLRDKAIKPPQVSLYRTTHDARKTIQQSGLFTAPQLPSDENTNYRYGLKTKYGENVRQLVQYEFESEWITERFQSMRVAEEKEKQKLQFKNHLMEKTRARKSAILETRKNEAATDKEPFKMSKFKNIAPKVHSQSPKRNTDATETTQG